MPAAFRFNLIQMEKLKILVWFILFVLFFEMSSCSPDKPDSNNVAGCKLISDYDSVSGKNDSVVYHYNSQGELSRLIHFRSGLGGVLPNIDTFFYENNILTRVDYNLYYTIRDIPYARTDSFYNDGKIIRANMYYGQLVGLSTLASYSTFTYNSNGQITEVHEEGVTWPGGETITTRFEYDNRGNLSKIYLRDTQFPQEYLESEFLDYDDHPNPYYKMPWESVNEFYIYYRNRLSPNNVGKIIRHQRFPDGTFGLPYGQTYHYTYDNKGRVVKMKEVLWTNGSTNGVRIFKWGCN